MPSRNRWRYVYALLAIMLFGISPFLVVAIAGIVASANGCRLDEGSVHPCVLLGMDLGGTLYAMGVTGWFGLLTIPMAGILFVVWVIWLAVSFSKR